MEDGLPGQARQRQKRLVRSLPEETAHASARTSRLFADRVAAAAAAARRAAADRVAAARAGGVGHGAADGAHGDLAAAGPADAARPSQLELARVRHAGRLLAAQADVRGAEDLAHRHAQCAGVRDLSAGRAGLRRRRLGAQRARLRPGADAQARRPEGGDRQVGGDHRQILGQAAARLVRAGPDADLRHARPSLRRRHRVHRRLGARRRAGHAQDHAQAGGRPAL